MVDKGKNVDVFSVYNLHHFIGIDQMHPELKGLSFEFLEAAKEKNSRLSNLDIVLCAGSSMSSTVLMGDRKMKPVMRLSSTQDMA